MESASRPRVYATARRAARAATFGRRNLTGRHAYDHLVDIEKQPASRQAAASPESNTDKENDTPPSGQSTSSGRTALLRSESRSPSEERDVCVDYNQGSEAEAPLRPTSTFPESTPAPSSSSIFAVLPTGPNTPCRYWGPPSPTSPPYYPETPEPETQAPQTPRKRSVTRSIKPKSQTPQTSALPTPRARERFLTRSIKQESSEPFCSSGPTIPASRENTLFRGNNPFPSRSTIYKHITDCTPTKPLLRESQAGPSAYAGSKRPLGDRHKYESIGNLEGLFWLSAVHEDAGSSKKRRRVHDAGSSLSSSPPQQFVTPVKRVPLGELTFAESSFELESSPPSPSCWLRPVKRVSPRELTFTDSLPGVKSPSPVRHFVRPVNRVPLGELRFEEMPKKASKRKRVSVVSAPGEGAGQPSPQKRMRRSEQVMEETVRVLVPASSAQIEEEQAEDEEKGRAGEEERVVISQTTRKTIRKNTAGRAASRTATTLKDKQDAGINVDLGRVNNALQGIAPAITTHHQNASPAPGPTYDVYDLYDYDEEYNIRSKVDRLLENDVNHLLQKSSIVEGACTAITALVTQVEDLRKSQKSLDGKLARASKSIEASKIRPELKQDLHRKLKGGVSKASENIGDIILPVERAIMEVVKGIAGARKWVGKVSKELEKGAEKSGKKEGSREEVGEVGYVEMAHRKGNSARRPGPPKVSKPKFFDLIASSEEKARNLKKTEDYYALLNRRIMEKEREIRRTRAGQSGEQHALAQRSEQMPRRAEAPSERTREVKEEREDWCESQELESGEEKVREDSSEVSVKEDGVLEDEEYEDEVNENSPPRDLKNLPAPAPLPRRRLGDGIASAAASTKALAPVRLGSEASTECVTIPAFGTRRGPRAHTPPLHQKSNNDDEWAPQQVEVLFNGMRLFGRMGPRKWAQAVKDWDETGGKGKGRAGEGDAGGERALRGKSVKEIERKWMELAIGFVEMDAVEQWMGVVL